MVHHGKFSWSAMEHREEYTHVTPWESQKFVKRRKRENNAVYRKYMNVSG